MDKSDKIVAIFKYMDEKWPNPLPADLKITDEQIKKLLPRIIEDFSRGNHTNDGGESMHKTDSLAGYKNSSKPAATKQKNFYRITGISGSGKSSQLLPCIEKWFENKDLTPVLVAARFIPQYHPFFNEILDRFGKKNLRKMTDNFSTKVLFSLLFELVKAGYDIILDVALLNEKIETFLISFLEKYDYKTYLTATVIAPEIAETFINNRHKEIKRIVRKETAEEFINSFENGLTLYSEKLPEMPMILWSIFDKTPIFNDKAKNLDKSLIEKYMNKKEIAPETPSEKALFEAKQKFFTNSQ